MGGKRSREDPASWPGREQKPLTVLNILLGLYEINTEVYGHGESLKTFEPSDAGTRREEFIRRRDRPLGIVRGQKALRPMGLSTLAGLVDTPGRNHAIWPACVCSGTNGGARGGQSGASL